MVTSVIERVFLIGNRGTGKSTIAQLLAPRLSWDWCDADEFLEQRCGITIKQIFESEGEAGFRAREAAILAELAQRRRCVIATGGGIVLRPENRDRLKAGLAIWLTAEPNIIWQRLQGDATTGNRRPNLIQGGLAEIQQLLAIRQPLYQACADWTIDTTLATPAEIAADIAAWLQARGGVDILKT